MENQDIIMVTGASSGVGKACACLLAGLGYQVVAGVRREVHGLELTREHPDYIRFVVVDLQDQNAIQAAAETLAGMTHEKGLKGLVNCAGNLYCGPLEYFPREQWFEQYDVNLFGTMALTRAMLPLIRRAHGRIITIGAVGGGVSLPFYGAIASSKIALQAVNDCLRRELHPWGIHVVIIEPGGIDTPANLKMRNSVRKYLDALEPRGKKRYGHAMEAFSQWAYDMHTHNLKPEQVAGKVLTALRARRPKTRYRIGRDSRGVAILAWLLPDRLFDRLVLWITSLPVRFGAWRDRDNYDNKRYPGR